MPLLSVLTCEDSASALRCHCISGPISLPHRYDQKGTNFHIPLNGNVATMSIDEQIPDAELPELPGDLCGIWSFIKWELAGCPNRSQEESHHEYQLAIEAGLAL